MAVELGKVYRDSLTGYEGTATARFEYLYGCIRICLETCIDGKPDERTFDEQRLTDKPAATSGGPRPSPPKREAS